MADESYLQFPLCALSFGANVEERLDTIISYAIVQVGSKLWRRLPLDKQQQFLQEARKSRALPTGFDSDRLWHREVLYAAHVIGITLVALTTISTRYWQLHTYVEKFEARHGRDARVRIKKKWVFDTRDHRGLTYREFAVLCGIYSAIGDKELARITRDRIRHCALGYRTAAIMRAELPGRGDKEQPLTDRRLRDTIDRLHRNKFFARCTVARRITYYSIRLDNEAFRKKILERRTYPKSFRATQAAQDEALTAAINQKNRGAPEIRSADDRLDSPLRGHSPRVNRTGT